jgi:hypothetical protein
VSDADDVVGFLMRRVGLARAEAEHAVERSAILLTARRALADRTTMVRRCAWCQRLLLAGVWVPEEEVPDFVGHLLDERTSHGICESCIERLQKDGDSRPFGR